ncbi:MAG: lipopolysaccharide kinase InaA family protein [Actinomycetota bacterium]|nr:lipopolysaccharide kinase InaA family protein [Actinomycetota bacterium]
MTTSVQINVPDADRTVRSPTDALRFVTASIVGFLTTLIVLIFPDTFGGLGQDLSEIFDDAAGAIPEIVGLIVTVLVLAVPLIILVFFVRERDFRRIVVVVLAALLAAAATWGTIAWIAGLLADEGFAPEYGTVIVAQSAYYPYVAALTAAITAAAPWLPRRWQRASWAALASLVVVRLVLGSNLPAELVLALSIGVAAGSGILFIIGSPNRHPSGEEIVATLERSGIEVSRLDAAQVDARGSTPYFVETVDGSRMFVKTLSTDERSADLLFRLYRRFRFKNIGDEPAFSTLRRAVEHEALLSYSASAAGVRTPPLVAVGVIGEAEYSMLLAYEAIEGRSLDSIEADELTDEILTQIWEQVAILRVHGIAHRDLRLANVFLDETRTPWIIDFGFSELAASDLLFNNDVAELITSSAFLVGPESAVRSAVEVLGSDAVADAGGRIQPQAFGGATKTELKERGDHIDRRIRDEIVHKTGRTAVPLDRIQRLDPGHRIRNRGKPNDLE